MTKQRLSFYTQGCRLNQAETAVMEQQFSKQFDAFDQVPFSSPADVVVVNTCTVTENGDADTRRLVNKIVRQNPEAKIALVGCQSQILKEKLLELPNVQWVIGNADKLQTASIISSTYTQTEPVVEVKKLDKAPFTIDTPAIDTHHTRANLKIQDGCDFYCAFCVIPFARGPARSRDFADIIREVRALVDAGHKELVLTGINVGTYSHDGKTITDVVDALTGFPELARLRISSIEPTTIPWDVIDKMKTGTSMCRYLHVPLQSGSDTILKAMNRHYSVAEYTEFISNVFHAVPDIGLGTDVIVGFPGETDALFNETLELLTALPLAYFHVFSYSDRPFARSHKSTEKIAPAVIAKRSEILRQLSIKKRQGFFQKQLGKTVTVLVEQHKNGFWTGLTDHYIRVQFKHDEPCINQMIPVKLTDFSGDKMMGRRV
jgi:threonylcarbamoyladenosine tRNA methylthiotransferase MtaB